MQANVFLLMLTPTLENNVPSYSFLSTFSDTPTIPSIELQKDFGSMDNVLKSITEYYLGETSFSFSYILYDVFLGSDILNIYYYTFLSPGLETKNGIFLDINEIKHIYTYQKLLNKIYR
jgi:hypothetical protein